MILKTERLRDDEKIIKILNTDQLNPLLLKEALEILRKYVFVALEEELYGVNPDTILVLLSLKIFREFYIRYLESLDHGLMAMTLAKALDKIWPDIYPFLPKDLRELYINFFIEIFLKEPLLTMLNKKPERGLSFLL